MKIAIVGIGGRWVLWRQAETPMQLDRQRGNRTEIDIFTDYIKQTGLELGIPTPLHDEIYNQLLNL